MEAPYTIEELRSMTPKEFLALPKKCPRLHPYCLIGLHIDDARNRMKEWTKYIGNRVEMLSTDQGCLLDINTTYYICEVDENSIMTDVHNAFEGEE